MKFENELFVWEKNKEAFVPMKIQRQNYDVGKNMRSKNTGSLYISKI